MMLSRFVLLGFALLACAPAHAEGLLSPSLHIAKGGDRPQVALTLDACSGKTDKRILDMLVSNRIPATIFVTARWMRSNGAAFAVLKANPDLFEIENHGAAHVPAVLGTNRVFGVKPAGSLEAVRAEVKGGAQAIAASGPASRWYRGATARYSPAAVAEIKAQGFSIAGFSLNADQGASLPAAAVERRVRAARDGDVIIAHVNQPSKPAGAGLVAGITALKARGFRFVRLKDVGSRP